MARMGTDTTKIYGCHNPERITSNYFIAKFNASEL
jgi:hypothetical protein